MTHTTTKVNGNVILVEPNVMNGNENQTNTIPQYQDMYIFAELKATRKGRTVIVNNSVSEEFSADYGTINFIGNNQDNTSDNPNYLNFTTNYYEDSVGNKTQYEGFGITDIKVQINSSYIPKIRIKFLDIRGLAFFNQEDSPYRMLFDFPPPIFELTFKGYYGKPLTYKLHLVKYNSEFSSDDGNFVIDAEFVALTFAPLTDILFKYILNTPLIELGGDMSSNAGDVPRTTMELILKLKSLYGEIKKMLDKDEDAIELRGIERDLETVGLAEEVIINFNENEILTNVGTPYLAKRSSQKPNLVEIYRGEEKDNLVEIRNIREFNNKIIEQQSSKDKNFKKERLYILYQVSSNISEEIELPPDPTPADIITNPIGSVWSSETQNEAAYYGALYKFKERLLGNGQTLADIDSNDIEKPKPLIINSNLKEQNDTRCKYYGMEITDFYYKLYYEKGSLISRREELVGLVTDRINASIIDNLGMFPSVYNVFKIILDDVDKFFEILKKTSVTAHESHNEDENKKIIIGHKDYGEKTNLKTIYPFPLIINRRDGIYEERVAPIDLSEKVEFPELTLVSDFINTFLDQDKWEDQYDFRGRQNDDGNNYWIPIAPIDSILGGANPTSPYIGVSDNIRDSILKILLTRYYIFSQGVLPYDIYPDYDTSELKKGEIRALEQLSDSYVELYGVTEAINLNEGLTTKKAADVLDEMCKRYKNDIRNFYNDIENLTARHKTSTGDKIVNLYDFPKNEVIAFPVTPSDSGSAYVYTDKNEFNFIGLDINTERISISDSNDRTNRLNEFISENREIGGNRKATKRGRTTYQFTTDNLLYLSDEYEDGNFTGGKNEKKGTDTITVEGIETGLYTRFLNKYTYFPETLSDGSIGFDFYGSEQIDNFPEGNSPLLSEYLGMVTAYNEGHDSFAEQLKKNMGNSVFSMGNNIIDVWAYSLGKNDNDEKLFPYLDDDKLGSVLFLSNFGNTLSPFAQYPNDLRTNFFMIPSIIETPLFVNAYIGALLTAIDDGWENDILNFFTGTTVTQEIMLPNKGYYVLADLHDVKNYLTESDKKLFKNEYEKFRQYFVTFFTEFNKLYNTVNEIDNRTKIERYKYFLDPNADNDKRIRDNTAVEKGQFEIIIERLITRQNIVVYSEKTFNRAPLSNYSAGYTSLWEKNREDNRYKQTTDKYFTTLFSRLSSIIGKRKDELKDEYIRLQKIKGDRDVINQLYYSFKNINDKWLTGTGQNKANYPMISGSNTKLIDKFKFVDRAMNPIGETIINAEMLIDLVDNDNASVFTVLSSLLSANGFIFFPLQNFLSFDDDESWEDTFKLHTGSIQNEADTYFVAMYIGGTSSYPSIKTNGFEEDGIIDISAPDVADFSTKGDSNPYEENESQEKNGGDFPWRQVRAFRVRFGEQNQSMFKDIKIDSKEYTDTNESIQILSRLAGDNKESSPTPKGQNLYNVYENRSYKASITGLGNAMIQPTQYFQLENVPMFNGAYIILDVEHNITPNKMTTTFSGTKILKYPIPRVIDPVALRDYSDVSSGEAARRAGESRNLSAKKQQSEVIPQSTMMTQERLDQLNSVYGIDVSHRNGNINWKQMKTNSVDVSFAIMKITQGNHLYSGKYSRYDFVKNVEEAKENGVEVTFYHFAEFGRTNNPADDAVADANYCISKLTLFDKPKLPIVLDLEMDCFTQVKAYRWSNRDADVKTYVLKWIEIMKGAGYEIMIYTAPQYLKKVSTDYLSNYPLWYARPTNVNGSMNSEVWEPSTPISKWYNWDIWQFSFQGNVTGIDGNVDLNAMKKTYFNKYV